MTHGSWDLISARVGGTVRTVKPDQLAFEKSWITEYVRARHRWLTEIRRLRVTNYRTKFFLDQIAIGNWDLKLPVTVHGVRLNSGSLERSDPIAVEPTTESEPGAVATGSPQPEITPEHNDDRSALQTMSDITTAAAENFDRVNGVITTVATRKDAAKSLWTTVAGTLSQAVWGVFGSVIGLPRIVWITVAIVAASLAILYLYRQITLGKIREARSN